MYNLEEAKDFIFSYAKYFVYSNQEKNYLLILIKFKKILFKFFFDSIKIDIINYKY